MRGRRVAGRAARLAVLAAVPLLFGLVAVVPRGGAAGEPVVVTSEGGTVTGDDVTLTFAADAVAAPTKIAVTGVSGLPAYDGRPPLMSFTVEATLVDTGEAVPAFAAPVRIDVAVSGLDEPDAARVRLAELTADGAWQLLDALPADGTLSGSIAAAGTFAVVVDLPPRRVEIAFEHRSNAPDEGLHRIDPGGALRLHVAVTPDGAISGAQLVESIPEGWTVVNAGGGTWEEGLGLLTWDLGSVAAGSTAARSFVVRAPLAAPTGAVQAFGATFGALLTYTGGARAMDDVTVLVAPAVVVAHAVVATVDGSSFEARYLPADVKVDGVQAFDVLRVRFQLRNADTVPVTLSPQLEVGSAGSDGFVRVPDGPGSRAPFRLYREWTRPASLRGLSEQGPASASIPADTLRVQDTDWPDQRAATGIHAMAENPFGAITLEPLTYTEVELTVAATQRAEASTVYRLRLTDAGAALPGAAEATVETGATPPLQLTPGQRQGTPVEQTQPAGAKAEPAAAAGGVAYRLLAAWTGQAATAQAPGAPVTGTHGPYSATSDQCALCHAGHTAKNRNLLVKSPPQSQVCLTCHDGSGASTNVAADYADPGVPPNSAERREYYRHPALDPSSHTSAQADEFGGVLDRHSECGDCHNAHTANGDTNSAPGASGWRASSRLSKISGVSVVNQAAGTSPTYTFLDGGSTLAFEYQLCFKCHSGATVLPSNAGFTPSRYVLDKGVELNPANPSYHPVEAAGTNTTQKMQDSLDGTSPYKLWNFTTTSTVRCSQCHASQSRYGQSPQTPAGSSLPSHTSRNRGILLQRYRDRLLMGSEEAYAAADFALCFLCHGEAPFVEGGGTAETNFPLHRRHVGELGGKGSGGTDIDTPGDGQGNAICAECHFRIHSTTYKDGEQTISGTRLVNFAPVVLPETVGGIPTRSWTSTGTGSGTCTLRCHGKPHTSEDYQDGP